MTYQPRIHIPQQLAHVLDKCVHLAESSTTSATLSFVYFLFASLRTHPQLSVACQIAARLLGCLFVRHQSCIVQQPHHRAIINETNITAARSHGGCATENEEKNMNKNPGKCYFNSVMASVQSQAIESNEHFS